MWVKNMSSEVCEHMGTLLKLNAQDPFLLTLLRTGVSSGFLELCLKVCIPLAIVDRV